MRETFIPLFTSTIRSSLWSLPGDCIKVFLTLALEADPEGCVSASVDGIRRLVDLPLADVQRHLDTLSAPDPHSKDTSRDPSKDGRRIERIPNGWRVVNIEWYREECRRQAELFRKRRWWAESGSGARRDARRTETEMETNDLPTGDSATPKRRRRPPKAETPLPADWTPSKHHREYAAMKGLNLDDEVFSFKGWAEGRTALSWNGTFSTRLANSVKWRNERGGAAKPEKSEWQRKQDEGEWA